MDPESGSARLRKERTGMALIMLTKKTRCRLAASAAIIAVVSLGIAPSSAYAQHRGGGGGGFHGGGGFQCGGYGYPSAYGGYPNAPNGYASPARSYAPYSGAQYGQPNLSYGIPGGNQPSASSHPPY